MRFTRNSDSRGAFSILTMPCTEWSPLWTPRRDQRSATFAAPTLDDAIGHGMSVVGNSGEHQQALVLDSAGLPVALVDGRTRWRDAPVGRVSLHKVDEFYVNIEEIVYGPSSDFNVDPLVLHDLTLIEGVRGKQMVKVVAADEKRIEAYLGRVDRVISSLRESDPRRADDEEYMSGLGMFTKVYEYERSGGGWGRWDLVSDEPTGGTVRFRWLPTRRTLSVWGLAPMQPLEDISNWEPAYLPFPRNMFKRRWDAHTQTYFVSDDFRKRAQ